MAPPYPYVYLSLNSLPNQPCEIHVCRRTPLMSKWNLYAAVAMSPQSRNVASYRSSCRLLMTAVDEFTLKK